MIKSLSSLLIVGTLLSGCASTGIQNPVSNNSIGTAVATYGVLESALIAYRGLPRCTITNNFSANNICYKRSVLVQAVAYEKATNTAINRAVKFQRNNPTLDATSYIDSAIVSVATFKDFAVAAHLPGVQ
jgi:hypothetical protein